LFVVTCAVVVGIALVVGVVTVSHLGHDDVRPRAACDDLYWTTSWMAAPVDSSGREPAVPPEGEAPSQADSGGFRAFTNQTFRMMVSPHIAGTRARIELSNRFGNRAVVLDGIRIGVREEGPAVLPSTETLVTFGGENKALIRAGQTAVSDPVAFNIEPFKDVAVTFHLATPAPLDVHVAAQSLQFASPAGSGDFTDDTTGRHLTQRMGSWLALSAIDVVTPGSTSAVAVLGDSLTDGIGSSFDKNLRWPDDLQRRLLFDPNQPELSVLNAGISGNQIAYDRSVLVADNARGAGPAGVHRVSTDALKHDGVTSLIVYLGINDLFAAASASPARDIIDAYQSIISQAHAADIRVIGATLTPGNLPPDTEADRQAVNEWIRHSGQFDAVLDFDAVVRNPASPDQVAPQYTNEIVHLNDAGYQALADSIDLTAIRGNPCVP
jgi:lysophospholipase L1-like esterase